MNIKFFAKSLLITAVSGSAFATPTLIIINHTNKPISYIVQRDDFNSLVGSKQGTLAAQQQTRLKVNYRNKVCEMGQGVSNPSAYISTGWNKSGVAEYDDFFGAGRGCTQAHQDKRSVYSYGYLSSHLLAFSMYNAQANHGARVIFCTSQDYVKNGNKCL